MGSITTGIGLVSGINTAQLIESIMTLESQPKVRLQERLAKLQAQKTAMLDVNARLLNFGNAASAFRLDEIFKSVFANSSNEEIFTASATTKAPVGTYNFIVKQLVSSSQKMTAGFADADFTPVGLDGLSFEFGHGNVAVDRELADLNGGAGVAGGGIVITDRSGNQATIDLTDTTTVGEVLERINDADGVAVTASVEGDAFVLTDTSGGSGTLSVANAIGDTTATDLGLAGSAAGDTLTGTGVFSLGGAFSLSQLNDGNGVIIRNNVPDLRITAKDGSVFEVDLGRVDAPITADTELADLNNGAGITIADGEADFKVITTTGETVEINLGDILDENDEVGEEAVTTVGQLINRVNDQLQDALGTTDVSIALNSEGNGFTLSDNLGGAGDLQVTGAGPNGDETAEDLGLLGSSATGVIDGEVVPNTVQSPPAKTMQDVINRINNALQASTEDPNNGRIVASLGADGKSLTITDNTGGGGNLIVRGFAADPDEPNAADDLGIYTGETGIAGSVVNGRDIIGGLGSVLVNSLNGGSGLSGATTISVTDRAGNIFTLNNLDTFTTLDELLDALNQAAADNGVAVDFDSNTAGNGLLATDTSGGAGNLTIAGDGADALGLTFDNAANSVNGGDLELQYISAATALSDLNYGKGIGTGSFKITDGFGESATINIGTDSETLYDVMQEINSRGLAIKARINDTGDGLLIEADTGGEEPFVPLKVESVSGSTAKDLGILGQASTVDNAFIDGSYEKTIDLDESDTLNDVVGKINEAGVPVSATVINTGSGSTPYRLSLTSGIAGTAGELVIDSGEVDLGLTTVQQGADAKVFFGSSDPETALLVTSSTNSLTDVLPGVTIDLKAASDEVQTLEIGRDDGAVIEAVKKFVTTFNDAVGTIDNYDFYDVDTEEKGVLLGNATTGRVRAALFRTLTSRPEGVTGQFQFLTQVGIEVGSDGTLALNEEKFAEALETDREAVEELFAAFEQQAASSEEILPGVTVQSDTAETTVRGMGEIFDDLIDQFTNSIDGTLTLADQNFQSIIDLVNDRIEAWDERLAAKKARLEQQYANLELTLAQMQNQGGALQSLAGNVFAAQSAIG